MILSSGLDSISAIAILAGSEKNQGIVELRLQSLVLQGFLLEEISVGFGSGFGGFLHN
jgi:hypothetical protein